MAGVQAAVLVHTQHMLEDNDNSACEEVHAQKCNCQLFAVIK
jgi:hypothetical protein